MTAKKLNEARVHELIAQYASAHNGAIPSTTEIILLNGGKGSPSSANIYRKTYQLKMQEQQAGADPLAAFPETVANAVKTMQGTLEAQAEERVTALREEMAAQAGAAVEVQAELQAQLDAALADNAELQAQLRQTTLERESLAQDKAALEAAHRASTDTVNTLELELANSTERAKDYARQLDAVGPSLQAQEHAITQLTQCQEVLMARVAQSEARYGEGVDQLREGLAGVARSVEVGQATQAALIAANEKATEGTTQQAALYQTEVNRLNQLVDDLRQALKQGEETQQAETQSALVEQVTTVEAAVTETLALLQAMAKKLNTLAKKPRPKKT